MAQRNSSTRATSATCPVRASSARARPNSAASMRLSPLSQASVARSLLPLASSGQSGGGGVLEQAATAISAHKMVEVRDFMAA